MALPFLIGGIFAFCGNTGGGCFHGGKKQDENAKRLKEAREVIDEAVFGFERCRGAVLERMEALTVLKRKCLDRLGMADSVALPVFEAEEIEAISVDEELPDDGEEAFSRAEMVRARLNGISEHLDSLLHLANRFSLALDKLSREYDRRSVFEDEDLSELEDLLVRMCRMRLVAKPMRSGEPGELNRRGADELIARAKELALF